MSGKRKKIPRQISNTAVYKNVECEQVVLKRRISVYWQTRCLRNADSFHFICARCHIASIYLMLSHRIIDRTFWFYHFECWMTVVFCCCFFKNHTHARTLSIQSRGKDRVNVVVVSYSSLLSRWIFIYRTLLSVIAFFSLIFVDSCGIFVKFVVHRETYFLFVSSPCISIS